MNKRGQGTTDLPYGLIFSILLIIVFISVAFVAIKSFMNTGKCSSIGLFYEDFQEKVDSAWRSSESNFEYKIDLPFGVEKVCFGNFSLKVDNFEDAERIDSFNTDANLFILPSDEGCNMAAVSISHLDISELSKNPYCFQNKKSILLIKNYGDKLVSIK